MAAVANRWWQAVVFSAKHVTAPLGVCECRQALRKQIEFHANQGARIGQVLNEAFDVVEVPQWHMPPRLRCVRILACISAANCEQERSAERMGRSPERADVHLPF